MTFLIRDKKTLDDAFGLMEEYNLDKLENIRALGCPVVTDSWYSDENTSEYVGHLILGDNSLLDFYISDCEKRKEKIEGSIGKDVLGKKIIFYGDLIDMGGLREFIPARIREIPVNQKLLEERTASSRKKSS